MAISASRSNLILLVFLAVVFAVSSTLVVISVVHIERTGLTVEGIEDGAVLTAAAMSNVRITARDPRILDRVEVLVDDTAVATRREGDRLSLKEVRPAEGRHTLIARAPSATSLSLTAEVEFKFTVDNTSEPWRAGLQVAPAGLRGAGPGDDHGPGQVGRAVHRLGVQRHQPE
ncbi:hypothetical protein [Nocardia sp. NRRL S-836]|uniref:hypothetical protein n=1 Tax=Nocardia sp. NRRL S-836 TaxID=1519492 RepID=UPI0006ADA705|nr:hypothetical protein [Nocardia sp. NRRL S-836]KOV88269.1 hypothetical protein ADL03_05030 [Nocardia sp. NRRL S-836]